MNNQRENLAGRFELKTRPVTTMLRQRGCREWPPLWAAELRWTVDRSEGTGFYGGLSYDQYPAFRELRRVVDDWIDGMERE